MTAPEVEWVLDTLGAVATAVGNDYTRDSGDPVVLKRVDRDESQIYGTGEDVTMSEPLPEREGQLETGAFVGARRAPGTEEPAGSYYNLNIDHVVGLRLEGLAASQYGHIDPSGEDGIPWEELKQRVRSALYDERHYPTGAGASNVTFTDLQLTNPSPQSGNYRDYYRWDVDVVFNGVEYL